MRGIQNRPLYAHSESKPNKIGMHPNHQITEFKQNYPKPNINKIEVGGKVSLNHRRGYKKALGILTNNQENILGRKRILEDDKKEN